MKVFNLIWVLFISFSVLVGCDGKQGATGPTGPTGPGGTPAPNTFQATFQNGVFPTSSYSGELDTWLLGNSGAYQNASPYLEVNTGSAISNYARTLVLYDVSSLPSNATIISAELLLKTESATNVGTSPVTVGIHNLASSTFSGCHWASNASWISTGLTSWFACTGDASNAQEGYINPTTMSTVVFSSANNGKSQVFKWSIDPSVVQSWVTSATNNNGLILKSEGEFGEPTSTINFYPYNDATASNHATLIVSYE